MPDSETVRDGHEGVAVVGAAPRGPVGPGARERARRTRPPERPRRESGAENGSARKVAAGSASGRTVESSSSRATGRESSTSAKLDDDLEATGTAETAETSETSETSQSRSRLHARARRGRRARLFGRRAQVALVITCVAAILAAAAFATLWSNVNGQNEQRQTVAQVATRFLVDLTNFKSATVDADFAALQKAADPGSVFAKQAAQTFNSNIRGALIQAQASSLGEVRNLYVGNVSGSAAQIYAVVDQSYQNSKMSSPAHDVLDLTIDLTHSGSRWLISTVTVENPSGTSPSVP
jgi:hypothetical protein